MPKLTAASIDFLSHCYLRKPGKSKEAATERWCQRLSARNRREHVDLVAIRKGRAKFNARSIAENGKVSPDAWSFVAEPAFHAWPSSIKGGDHACYRIRRYFDLRLRFRKKRKERSWKNNVDLGDFIFVRHEVLSLAITTRGRVFLPSGSEVNYL
jgi:hypothetical protein